MVLQVVWRKRDVFAQAPLLEAFLESNTVVLRLGRGQVRDHREGLVRGAARVAQKQHQVSAVDFCLCNSNLMCCNFPTLNRWK